MEWRLRKSYLPIFSPQPLRLWWNAPPVDEGAEYKGLALSERKITPRTSSALQEACTYETDRVYEVDLRQADS